MAPARPPAGSTLRRRLVDELVQECGLRSKAVQRALLAVPRETFVPEAAARDGLAAVYRNDVIVTKRDERGVAVSSSSQPSMVAAMLEALDLGPGMRVLEVGTGTGWNAALLSVLVGAGGSVTSVDIDPDLVDAARTVHRAGGWRLDAVVGDGLAGWPAGAPYDRIVVTASTDVVPRAWFDQLVPGGLLVVPLRLQGTGAQTVAVLRRDAAGFSSVRTIPGGFMPMRTAAGAPGPQDGGPQLSAGEQGPSGRALVRLSGPGLVRLSALQRRRLLGLALGASTSRPMAMRAARAGLHLFVLLAATGSGVVMWDGDGMTRAGVVAASGPRLGLAVLDTGARVRALDLWGDPSAADALAALVAEWQALGRPGPDRLRVGVRYGRPSPTWRVERREGCVFSFEWAV